MTTNEPDGVPPVPTPASDAATPTPEATAPPAAAPEATPAAPAAPPAPPAYGPGAGAEQPYAAPQAAQAPYGAQPYGYQSGPALPKGLSLTAMITGIAGIVLGFAGWGFLLALAGVIFGHIGQRREPHAKAFWLTGLITGYVGLALNIIVGLIVLAAIFVPLILLESGSNF
jgi:hypothetical protein